eukprot:c24328_g1_i1 orf=125-1924(-)
MQDTLTFPTMGSPHHRFTFSQSYYTDYSEQCSVVSTPFVSAPSSPGRQCDGGFYFSAPTSPHWALTFTTASEGVAPRDYPSSIPLHWDEKPVTPRRMSNGKDEANSFLMTSDFEFSARFAELDDPFMSPTPMSSANELFCNGQIKPLKMPARTEYSACSTSRINMNEHATSRINMNEHATSRINVNEHAIGSLPNAFEFNSRGALNTSISAPHTPRFSSTSRGWGGGASPHGTSELNRGRSASSVSAPQSPRPPLNRVKGALCGVSSSRIDRAFDASMHMSLEVCRRNIEGSSRIDKAFDTSMHMSTEGSRRKVEGSRRIDKAFDTALHMSTEGSRRKTDGSRRSGRSMLSLAPLRFQDTGHRRTRSFSPLRIFQRGDHPSSQSSMGATERQDTHTLSRDSSANEKKHEEDSNSAEKSFNKKWTLKDLLHRKSGGENRSMSSRTSSRRSGASADSTSSSVEKMSAKSLSTGRSSSESSYSFISSHTCTKDVVTSMSSRGKTHVGDSTSNQSMCKKGQKHTICDVKSSSQKGIKGCVQKGNKGSISPHEMHYMMHKAQSEELRKRTFLPYRQGLLGCLGFTSRSYRTVSTISKTLQSVSG